MKKLKMLSGQELLDEGMTKLETTLPQTDSTKDIFPNGSWLEQKQIQSALEDRKHLVEAQRIEKCGALSHAKWLEELKLAEVTQQVGPHWQFLGHHKDKILYLKPEEALFLMEVNCLLLTYDEIVVSLQQAYTLLLSDEMPIYKYKVYASLSRLGYKVFQHVYSETTKENKDESQQNVLVNEVSVDNCEVSSDSNQNQYIHLSEKNKVQECSQTCGTESQINEKHLTNEKDNVGDKSNYTKIHIDSNETEISMDTENEDFPTNNSNKSDMELKEINCQNLSHEEGCCALTTNISICDKVLATEKDPITKFSEWKLEKITSRRFQSGTYIDLHKSFDNIPDLLSSPIVTINVPKGEYLPKNILLNNFSYVLNLENVTSKNIRPQSMDSRTYSLSDEVNGDHIRRVTSSNTNFRSQNVGIPPFYHNFRQNVSYRHFTNWRPRLTLNYFQFNLFFQRHFMPGFNIPRFQFYPRTHLPMFPRYFTNPTIHSDRGNIPSPRREDTTIRKRKRNTARKQHLDSIKNLATRLRHLISVGNIKSQNMEALQKLIETYNVRYSTRLRLTEDMEITNDETIIETIDLDDDEEVHSKKRRIDKSNNLQDIHLSRIQEISRTLKHLNNEGKASARHRRAFSGLIKTYNRCYNADIYVNDNNDILDRRSITLDSSSESDNIPEKSTKVKSGKKLRNPFNILKRLSEKNKINTTPTTSKQEETDDDAKHITEVHNSVTGLEKNFSNDWLPSYNDFGKPEIVKNENMDIRIADSKKDDFIYDFFKGKAQKFHNWVETKIAFLESIEETNAMFRTEAMKVDNVEIKSIIKSEDCTNLSTVLKKLNIIKTTNNNCSQSSLSVDFDVYNRDVQNFRKANRRTPHFRIVCLDAFTPCPTGTEIASLHSKYGDDVMLVFAIVGVASISYLQIYPTDLPVFTSSNDVG